ncbi:multidrug effflux MFS transporter [Gallaecimonas sp. GXIMD4217]|uniref:multidrug effflux MFS transporter n=1 Tax=Gallaecimonas sp. GXIMD4217 TaxID=3131927 RepID=UPI00311B0B55
MPHLKWLLLCLVLFSPLGIDIYLPAIPAIAQGLGAEESLIQSTVSLFLLMMGLGQVIAGPLCDRFGRRPVALGGMALYLAGALMAVCAESGALFVFSRLLQGLAVCGTSVVAFSAVRDTLEGEESARAYSFLNGTLNIVPALAPLLGGLLAEQFGWQAPFWLLVVYSLAMMAVMARFLPETKPANTRVQGGLPLRQYARILGDGRFLGFALVNGAGMGMVLSYVSLAPQVLISQVGLSPVAFSLVFGINGLWIMAASYLANQVIRRFGRVNCLATAVVLLGLGALSLQGAYLLAGSTVLAYMLPVALACAGFAFALGPATSYALAPFGEEAGVASAMLMFVQMAGASVIGLVVLALPQAPQPALAGAMVLAALTSLQGVARARRQPS